MHVLFWQRLHDQLREPAVVGLFQLYELVQVRVVFRIGPPQQASSIPRATEKRPEPASSLIQDDKRTKVSTLLLADLLVALLNDIEGGIAGAFSCAEKYHRPVASSAADELKKGSDVLVDCLELCLVLDGGVFLSEKQIVLHLAVVVS